MNSEWTREKPTEPGFYWRLLDNEWAVPFVVDVRKEGETLRTHGADVRELGPGYWMPLETPQPPVPKPERGGVNQC